MGAKGAWVMVWVLGVAFCVVLVAFVVLLTAFVGLARMLGEAEEALVFVNERAKRREDRMVRRIQDEVTVRGMMTLAVQHALGGNEEAAWAIVGELTTGRTHE